MARILALSAIALSLALAGCTGADEEAPVESADTDPATAPETPPAGPPGSDGVGGAAGTAGADGAATRAIPVSYDGALDPGADVCQSSGSGGSCTGTPTSIRDGFEIDLEGAGATSFTITFVSSPTLPADDAFLVQVQGCNDDGCDVFTAAGGSALEVSGAPSGAPWTRLSVSISPEPQGTAGVGVYTTGGGEFHVEGAVEVVG